MAVDQFHVPEMSCNHCVQAISKAVSAVPGVQKVEVNLSDKSVRVEHTDAVGSAALVEAINEAGYEQVAVLA